MVYSGALNCPVTKQKMMSLFLHSYNAKDIHNNEQAPVTCMLVEGTILRNRASQRS